MSNVPSMLGGLDEVVQQWARYWADLRRRQEEVELEKQRREEEKRRWQEQMEYNRQLQAYQRARDAIQTEIEVIKGEIAGIDNQLAQIREQFRDADEATQAALRQAWNQLHRLRAQKEAELRAAVARLRMLGETGAPTPPQGGRAAPTPAAPGGTTPAQPGQTAPGPTKPEKGGAIPQPAPLPEIQPRPTPGAGTSVPLPEIQPRPTPGVGTPVPLPEIQPRPTPGATPAPMPEGPRAPGAPSEEGGLFVPPLVAPSRRVKPESLVAAFMDAIQDIKTAASPEELEQAIAAAQQQIKNLPKEVLDFFGGPEGIQARIQAAARRAQALIKRQAEIDARTKNAERRAELAEKARQYDAALDRIERRMEAAIQRGDVEGARRAAREFAAVYRRATQEGVQPIASPVSEQDAVTQAMAARKDIALRQAALTRRESDEGRRIMQVQMIEADDGRKYFMTISADRFGRPAFTVYDANGRPVDPVTQAAVLNQKARPYRHLSNESLLKLAEGAELRAQMGALSARDQAAYADVVAELRLRGIPWPRPEPKPQPQQPQPRPQPKPLPPLYRPGGGY